MNRREFITHIARGALSGLAILAAPTLAYSMPAHRLYFGTDVLNDKVLICTPSVKLQSTLENLINSYGLRTLVANRENGLDLIAYGYGLAIIDRQHYGLDAWDEYIKFRNDAQLITPMIILDSCPMRLPMDKNYIMVSNDQHDSVNNQIEPVIAHLRKHLNISCY